MPASQSDIERVRAAYEEFNARYAQLRTGDLTGFQDYCSPDIVMVSVDGWPVSGRYEGLAGYGRWLREVYAGTVENRFVDIEVRAVGEYVVATMLSRGRAEDDPMELEAPVGVIHRLSGGLITHAWVYLGHERALQSADAAAHVSAAFEDFNTRRQELRDPQQMRAYHERWYDPESRIVNVDGWPVAGSYDGFEGYARWYGENYATYEDVRFELESVEPVADRVVALARVSGRPAGADTRLEVQVGMTYELHGGRIRRVLVHVGHERAIEAAQRGD